MGRGAISELGRFDLNGANFAPFRMPKPEPDPVNSQKDLNRSGRILFRIYQLGYTNVRSLAGEKDVASNSDSLILRRRELR